MFLWFHRFCLSLFLLCGCVSLGWAQYSQQGAEQELLEKLKICLLQNSELQEHCTLFSSNKACIARLYHCYLRLYSKLSQRQRLLQQRLRLVKRERNSFQRENRQLRKKMLFFLKRVTKQREERMIRKVSPSTSLPAPVELVIGDVLVHSSPSGCLLSQGKRLLGYTPYFGRFRGNPTLRLFCKGYWGDTFTVALNSKRLVSENRVLEPLPEEDELEALRQEQKRTKPRRLPIYPVISMQKDIDVLKPFALKKRIEMLRIIQRFRAPNVVRPVAFLEKWAEEFEERLRKHLKKGTFLDGVTKAWVAYAKDWAWRKKRPILRVYPRAMAYVLLKGLQKGRSKERLAQLLVLYEKKERWDYFVE